MKYYSDVASELISNTFKRCEKELEYGCKSVLINIDNQQKQKFYDKPFGEYYTLECDNLFYLSQVVTDYMADCLALYIQNKLQKLTKKQDNKVLVACLGNGKIVCDSLGEKVFNKVIASNQSFTSNSLCAINPSVYGKTNIKSVDYIEAIVHKIKPDVCVVVDALCSHSITRIGSCVQVCDSGIFAGGAVNRGVDAVISKKSLGIPTLCIGVPLVVRVESIINDFIQTLSSEDMGDEENLYFHYKNVIVAPKNIDFLVNQSADLIAMSINKAILGLTKQEQEMLRV